MGSVLSYSGLSTKIRAMQSRLVTDEQLEEIVQLPNVPQVTAYLKRTPEYQNIWSGLDENDLHRGQIEKLLKKSIFLNFSRLYHFANQEQRTFLSLYSKRYEIRVLKEIMTNLFDHRDTDPVDISPYDNINNRLYFTSCFNTFGSNAAKNCISRKSYCEKNTYCGCLYNSY